MIASTIASEKSRDLDLFFLIKRDFAIVNIFFFQYFEDIYIYLSFIVLVGENLVLKRVNNFKKSKLITKAYLFNKDQCNQI